ncbi:hypothetical protein MCECM63_01604 [Methylophilaceae bacterium]
MKHLNNNRNLNENIKKIIAINEKDFIWGSRKHNEFLRECLVFGFGYKTQSKLNAAITSLKGEVQYSVDKNGKWLRMIDTDYLKMLIGFALGDIKPICEPIACDSDSNISEILNQSFGVTLPKQIEEEFNCRRFTFSN